MKKLNKRVAIEEFSTEAFEACGCACSCGAGMCDPATLPGGTPQSTGHAVHYHAVQNTVAT